MHDALVHIRETGTFPVSSSHPSTTNTTTSPSALTNRANHGCCCPPSPPPSPSLPKTQPPTKTTPTTRSLTTANPSPKKQPTLDSKEDLNTVGALPLTPSQLATTTAKIAAWLQPGHPGSRIFSQNPKQKIKLCLLDGFLLYAPPPHPLAAILPLLDIKLFLQTDRRRAVERRAARDGYVTLEGFWKDPPGYVEDVVWPNYVAAHRWLFEGGEVEGGRVDGEVLRREGIFAAPFDGEREDGGFGEVLAWAVGVVMRELERICLGEGVDGTEN